MDSTSPSQRIKDARERLGWSQEQLAHHARLTSKTVWKAEKEIHISQRSMRRIGEALDLDLVQQEQSA